MSLTIASIAQIHEMLGYTPPAHPLITVVESVRGRPYEPRVPLMNVRIVSELYSISLKNGSECRLKYGRQSYDFQAGSLMFMAPGQALLEEMPVVDSSAETAQSGME